MENNDFNDQYENDFDLKAVLSKYLIHWQWFVLAVGIGLLGAFLYLRYTIPQYQVTTTILVKDDKKGGMLSELSAFADLGMGGGMTSNLDNEIEILKSRTLAESTVKKLSLNITLISPGNLTDRELYNDAPISVNFIDKTNGFYESSIELDFSEMTPTTFELVSHSNNNSAKIITGDKKEFQYEKPITTKYGVLIISKLSAGDQSIKSEVGQIKILVSPVENVTASYQGQLKVEPVSKTSSVVALSINGPVGRKGEDFLNDLIAIYNEDAAADKTSFLKTLPFLFLRD
jgi:tyrosine-protein kinase Etk/Wzc